MSVNVKLSGFTVLRVDVHRVGNPPRLLDRDIRRGMIVARPKRGSGVHGLVGVGRDLGEAVVALMDAARERGKRYGTFLFWLDR